MPVLGEKLGKYELVSSLGAGGMGEVYRARDTDLEREVAIKVLPESVAMNEERIARFEREAKLLAALHHQHIAGIYGLEKVDSTRFLVLELVEGETLKERLDQGALPVEETLRLARQITDAIATAHQKGIIHRDLKPANIKVTADDHVKVLDFGIAKAFDSGGTATGISIAETISAGGTAAGTVIGTPAYMSPEQARGKPLDKRTDIWSFGCVLYECLTGERAFSGETSTDIIARILERDPDFNLLPAHTPPTIQLLLRRCLQKDRKRRLHDIGDARVELEEAIADPTGSSLTLTSAIATVQRKKASVGPWLLVLLGLVLGGAGAWMFKPSSPRNAAQNTPAEPTVSRLSIVLPVGFDLGRVDISPDGRLIAYAGREADAGPGDPRRIYLRSLDSFTAKVIPGTDGATRLRFNPDGRWLAYVAYDNPARSSGRVAKVAVRGGPSVTLNEEVDWSTNVAWLNNSELFVVTSNQRMLARLSADGGAYEEIGQVQQAAGEVGAAGVHVLPGGQAVLVTRWGNIAGRGLRTRTELFKLQTAEFEPLLADGGYAQYVSSGHLVFARGRDLFAVPFDLQGCRVNGSVVPVMTGLNTRFGFTSDEFRVSDFGHLIYGPETNVDEDRRLMTVDRDGHVEPLTPLCKRIFEGRYSPDGKHVAIALIGDNDLPQIWVQDLNSGIVRPISNPDDVSLNPRWSVDGQQVAYTVWFNDRRSAIYTARADSSAEPQSLLERDEDIQFWATSYAPAGDLLLFTEFDADDRRREVHMLDIASGQNKPLITAKDDVFHATFSPDGKWIAYASSETGRPEVIVRQFREDQQVSPVKYPISVDGGMNPMWSSNGEELFFMDLEDRLIVVSVSTEPKPSFSAPTMVHAGKNFDPVRIQDVSPDGQRFLFVEETEEKDAPPQINIVLNWVEELTRRMPATSHKESS